ncbi:protein of unknown function [Xenorhabdus poinarii G6]|uniref:Uncharacterized protein n=1 Tax=Xenorhabdus poinarii G6 TaxID=1354304 RepID=A0A068R3F8_9GAMM|nr:protein of unknown function [Xenorhabdus poinarii G6]
MPLCSSLKSVGYLRVFDYLKITISYLDYSPCMANMLKGKSPYVISLMG